MRGRFGVLQELKLVCCEGEIVLIISVGYFTESSAFAIQDTVRLAPLISRLSL